MLSASRQGREILNGPPGAIRTRDLRLRRASLYPAELRAVTQVCQAANKGRYHSPIVLASKMLLALSQVLLVWA